MLRAYDTRFRDDGRSPAIYLDPRCKPIVGEVKTLLHIASGVKSTASAVNDGDKEPIHKKLKTKLEERKESD